MTAMSQVTNRPEVAPQAAYITPAAAAAIAFLSPKTLSRLADEGKVRSIRPGTLRRYLRADIEALASDAQAAS